VTIDDHIGDVGRLQLDHARATSIERGAVLRGRCVVISV